MALIYAAAALGAVLFCASLVLLQKKSAPPQAGALAVLREAPVTVIFAPFLLAVAILLVAARQMDISVGGAGDSAVLMTAALVLVCAAGSGYILLFTYVRRAVAYPDRLELQSALGKTHSVRWQDIVEVKTTVTSKRVTPVSYTHLGDVELCAGNSEGVFPHTVQRAFAFGDKQAHRFPDEQDFGRHGQ